MWGVGKGTKGVGKGTKGVGKACITEVLAKQRRVVGKACITESGMYHREWCLLGLYMVDQATYVVDEADVVRAHSTTYPVAAYVLDQADVVECPPRSRCCVLRFRLGFRCVCQVRAPSF
jgi:hypothetical protein